MKRTNLNVAKKNKKNKENENDSRTRQKTARIKL